MAVKYSTFVGYESWVHTFRGTGATGRSTYHGLSGVALFILLIVFNTVAGAMKEVFNKVIDACISNRS